MITKTIYLGDFKTKTIHNQSKKEITTDSDTLKIKDSFSSSELIIVSLSSCIMTVMHKTAAKNGFDLGKVEISASKKMGLRDEDQKIIIKEIKIEIHFFESHLSDNQKEIIENSAWDCPVSLSISDNVNKEIEFHYVL